MMSFKKKRKIIRKKEIPHCHVKIKANKPSTYSTLVKVCGWNIACFFQFYNSLSLWINCRSQNIQNYQRLKKMYFLPSRREDWSQSSKYRRLLERWREQPPCLSIKKSLIFTKISDIREELLVKDCLMNFPRRLFARGAADCRWQFLSKRLS